MRARVGKIARLPGVVRHELNRRLHDGAPGKELVPWLNALPEVKQILVERFAGRLITEDNVSEWRHGGFQDWLREEDRRVRLGELSEDYHNGRPEKNACPLNAQMEQRLVLELAEELEHLSTLKNRAERWKRLQRISQELCRLQRTRNRGLEVSLFGLKTVQNVSGASGNGLSSPTALRWGERPREPVLEGCSSSPGVSPHQNNSLVARASRPSVPILLVPFESHGRDARATTNQHSLGVKTVQNGKAPSKANHGQSDLLGPYRTKHPMGGGPRRRNESSK